MDRETWYVMEDGSAGDPREIAPGDDGVLRHKDGRAVAYAPHGPRSRGVDADAERAKAAVAADAAKAKPAPEKKSPPAADKPKDKDVTAGPAGTYKTRDQKPD